MTNRRLLAIYLNDHLGGSVVAVERCRHARNRNRGNEFGEFLTGLLAEIEADRAVLRTVMRRVGAAESPVKKALSVAAERVARLKPNGRPRGHSPLSLYLELELLSVGVEGKRLLWLELLDLADPRLTEFDFPALAQRAADQRERIEQRRLAAGRIAFG